MCSYFVSRRHIKTQNQQCSTCMGGIKSLLLDRKRLGIQSSHRSNSVMVTCQSQHAVLPQKSYLVSLQLPSRLLSPTNYHDLYHSTILFGSPDAQIPSSK